MSFLSGRNYILRYRSDRSQWLLGLRRGFAASSYLGLRVRIPPVAWMSVSFECCVFVRQRFLRRADYSSRGVLSSAGCLSAIVKPRKGRLRTCLGSKRHRKKRLILPSSSNDLFKSEYWISKIGVGIYINCGLATNLTIQRLDKLLIILPYVACFRYSAIYMPMLREVA